MAKNIVTIGHHDCGLDKPLLLVSGPCVLESFDAALDIATKLQSFVASLPLNLVFKASFDKANRTSIDSFRGPGLEQGLQILERVKRETGLPVTTDVHEIGHVLPASEVCDLLQIPAFLARQTELLVAAAKTGKPVNVKKGQFMAPGDMQHVLSKLDSVGCAGTLLCERGTFFGYGRLVNDFRALVQMAELGVPVIFDGTHSVQEPGGLGSSTGGNRQMVEPLVRAAVAVGVNGLFLETHPSPSHSPSDGPNMVPLDQMPALLNRVVRIREAVEALPLD